MIVLRGHDGSVRRCAPVRRGGRLDLKDHDRVTSSMKFSSRILWSTDPQTLYFQRGLQVWRAKLADEATVNAEVEDTGVDAQGIVWDTRPPGRSCQWRSRGR
jgi:hypothetical protein